MDIELIRMRGMELGEELAMIRREIHARPELAWKEEETSRMVEKRLRELGFAHVRRGFRHTGSGVVADLEGGKAGPRVALRADIDALPVQEDTGLAYASKEAGVMHACGHDAHAAMLLGAARILSENREDLPGTVRVIFQPAEEAGYDSGAPAMIAEGALDGVAAIGGLHIWSTAACGKFGSGRGPSWLPRISGNSPSEARGGRLAPHTAVDPTVAVAHIISMLQTVVSREIARLKARS
jgi:amidohydrolase